MHIITQSINHIKDTATIKKSNTKIKINKAIIPSINPAPNLIPLLKEPSFFSFAIFSQAVLRF